MRFPIVCVVLSVVIGTFVEADSTTKQTTSTKATTTPALTTTTQNIKAVCAALVNCGDCVSNSECIWCESSKKCEADSSLFPKECSAKHTRRFVCAVSYRTVLIVIGSLAAVIGLAITIACCCCCRRRSKLNLKNRLTRDNIRQEHEDEERQAKHAARRAERQSKYDEIRQKYDLLTEVTCLTENMKKFEKQNLPSGRSMAQGDGETGVFTFAMPASDPNNHRGVSTRETSPVDGLTREETPYQRFENA